MQKKRMVIITTMLVLSIGNFTRLTGSENIRAIQFVSIFIIGVFTGLLINEFVLLFKVKKNA